MGFDRPFENRRLTLYAQVEPPTLNEKTGNQSKSDEQKDDDQDKSDQQNDESRAKEASLAQIRWEYTSPDGKWTSLSVEDETQNFARRGLISFIAPKDFTERKRFGKHLYWLRACWHKGEFQVKTHLRRLELNTTWARQGQTIRNEILGSSNGKKNQSFHTAQKPVLEGQQIEVRESQLDKGGQREEIWVLWHPQPDFYSSGRDARHYTFDHLTGEVRFGNGRQGKIPPRGRKNIRATRYRTGGGKAGNLLAETIIELKSSVPYIDSVTNPEPASGGVDQEELDRVKERGPKDLRHRNRAVTPEDFEDLARKASPEVARAKAIFPILKKESESSVNMTQTKTTFPIFKGQKMKEGQVGLILVPDSSEESCPTPTLNLIQRVREYLRTRCAATLDIENDLQIAGPTWVEVTVTATVVPTSSDSTDLAATVKEALTRFLHPLTGGTDGKGWPFGRQPYKSDLYALIQRLPNVEYVQTLEVNKKVNKKVNKEVDEEPETETWQQEPFLVYSGEHKITLASK